MCFFQMIDGELIKSKHKLTFIARRLFSELNQTENVQLIKILATEQLFDLNFILIASVLKQSIEKFPFRKDYHFIRLLITANWYSKKIQQKKNELVQKEARVLQYELKQKHEQIQCALSQGSEDTLNQLKAIKQIAELYLKQAENALWECQQTQKKIVNQIRAKLSMLPVEILQLQSQSLLTLLQTALEPKWAELLFRLQADLGIFTPLAGPQAMPLSPKAQKRIRSLFNKSHTFYETKFLSLIEKSSRLQQVCEHMVTYFEPNDVNILFFQKIGFKITQNAKQIKQKVLQTNLSSEDLIRLVFEARERLNSICQLFINEFFGGLTPLQWIILKAPRQENLALVECLLEQGADPLQTTICYKRIFFLPPTPKSAYDLARMTYQKEIMALCKHYEEKASDIREIQEKNNNSHDLRTDTRQPTCN